MLEGSAHERVDRRVEREAFGYFEAGMQPARFGGECDRLFGGGGNGGGSCCTAAGGGEGAEGEAVVVEDERAFDLVGEFADIAGPGVRAECGAALGRQREGRQTVVARDAGGEAFGEGDDVVAAFAQRRDAQAEEIEAMEQVFSEATGCDERAQVGIGGGHDAAVDGERAVSADAADGVVLDGLQQFGLKRGGQARQLVEEKGAALGGLEQADARLLGVGERTALMSEEFGFGERFGKRGAVDFDERTVGARSAPVEPAREGGLAGACLALDENGGRHALDAAVGGEDARERLLDVRERGAEEKGVVTGIAVLATAVFLFAAVIAGAARSQQAHRELIEVEGLDEVVGGARAHGFDGAAHAALGGHDDDGDARRNFAALEKGQTAAVGQVNVEEGEVEIEVAHRLRGLRERADAGHLGAEFFQMGLEAAPQERLVLDDQDPRALECHRRHVFARKPREATEKVSRPRQERCRPPKEMHPRLHPLAFMNTTISRSCLWLGALASSLLGLSAAAPLPAAERPNVLFIVCDDLNTYVSGYGGHEQTKTPGVDRLVRSSQSFTQAHCTVPICAPSRSSFLTGLYPHTSRNYGFDRWFENPVLKNSRTMMDHFRANGYHTLGTGKMMHHEVVKEWSEWGNDVDYGPFAFDGKEKVAHPDVPAPLRNDFGPVDGSLGPLMNLEGRVFGDGKTYSWRTGNWKKERPYRYKSDDDRDPTADELNGTWAVEKLRDFARGPRNKPFFMGVGFIRPHTPLIVPRRFFDLFPLNSIKLPVIKPGDVDDTYLHTTTGVQQGDLDRGAKIFKSLVASYGSTEVALQRFIQAYLASVASADEQIGRILDVIDGSPLKDNTIIILTGDHGWQMGQKDYVYKNSLWEESTRVPLIIRVPGLTQAGSATSHPVSHIDLYPTLVDLCGLTGDTRKNEQGRPLDGHSLRPFLVDPKTEKWTGPDAALIALFRWAKTYDPAAQSYALRSKDWRYIRYANGKEELYDHVKDPYEWTNLAGKPEHAARLDSFRLQLAARLPKPEKASSDATSGAEAWKDQFFKQHPGADTNKDGVLTWPEYKAYKEKLDAKKKKTT